MIWFKLKELKRIRIIVSLIAFISISFLFIDPWNVIPYSVSVFILSLQIIPTLLKILTHSGPFLIALIIVFGLTVMFGRIYCSTLCPLGTLQDIIIHIRKKIKRNRIFQYAKPSYIFHYTIFIAIVILTIGGSLTFLNLFEPLSNFGRIMTNAIEPIVTIGNNLFAKILSQFNSYVIYTVPLRSIEISVLINTVFGFDLLYVV